MSDSNSDADSNQREPGGTPLANGSITDPVKKLQEARKRREAKEATEDAYKRRQLNATDAANRLSARNLILTGVTALAATVACGGTWYQGAKNARSAALAQATLEQMRADSQSSSRTFQAQIHRTDANLGQTQIIANQAVNQATQITNLAKHTEELARQAKAQAEASQKIATNAAIQSSATQTLATNSAGQLSTMQGQLEFTDRPWIAVIEVKGRTGFFIQWAHPIHMPFRSFSETDTKMYGYFDVMTKNIGRSVAVDFAVYTELFFEAAPDGWDLKAEQTRFCEAVRRHESGNVGQVSALFPDVPRTSLMEAYPAILSSSAWQPDRSVLPALIGCVTYRFQNSPKPHQTRFLYLVRNDARTDNKLFRIEENVPNERIILERVSDLDYAD